MANSGPDTNGSSVSLTISLSLILKSSSFVSTKHPILMGNMSSLAMLSLDGKLFKRSKLMGPILYEIPLHRDLISAGFDYSLLGYLLLWRVRSRGKVEPEDCVIDRLEIE
jgi:hypothetical protein